jgi:RNA recognition motif-containing protein
MLYVSNLPHSATEESLTARFARCGTVISVRIVRDPATGYSRCFGFIEMATDAQAQTAIQRLNLMDCDGRLMSVNKASPSRT